VDYDTAFVIGLVGVVLGIPAFFSAYAEQRRPYLALLLFVAGGGAMAYAVVNNPGLYTPDHIMDAIFGVVARIVT